MKNKFFATAMAVAIAIPVIAIPVDTQAATKDFKDIPKTHVYYDNIMKMRDLGYINGYADGYFRPNQTILRQHAAVMISRAATLPKTVEQKAFNDVPKTHIYYKEITALQTAGIIQPDAKGNFNPNQQLTRGEMAKILAIAFDLKVKADYSFTDVAEDSPYSEYTKALYTNGVATGYEDGKFKPDEVLSRQHYAVFMYRAKNYDPNFVPKPIEGSKPEQPKPEPPSMSMDMTLEEFADAIKGNDLFNLKEDVVVNEYTKQEFNDSRFKKIIIEGQQFVKQTKLQYVKFGGFLTLEEPNHKSVLPGFMNTQISISTDLKDGMQFNIDYMNEDVVNITRQFVKLAYPELDLDQIIYEGTKETRKAYKKVLAGETLIGEYDGNATRFTQNGFSVHIGANSQMNYYWINITKL